MTDPFLVTSSAYNNFADVYYELQIMCSDRVDPSDPVLGKCEPQAASESIFPQTKSPVPSTNTEERACASSIEERIA